MWTPSLVGGLLIRQQSESVWTVRCRTGVASTKDAGTDRGRRSALEQSVPEVWMCFDPFYLQLGSEQP